MKKYIYSLFAAAALLLGTASCSSEDELVPSGKNEGVEVSFRLALDDAASSRGLSNDPTDDVYGRGTKVDNVIAAVFSGDEEIESLRKPLNSINADLTCNVTFRLIEGQTYNFVFWAEKKGTGYYDTKDLTAIKVNYAGNANDETRDAFTAVRKGLVVRNGDMKENIVLTRPFAQLNIASTDEDHEVAEAAGFGCNDLTSKVTVKGVYDTYNAFTEALADSKVDIDFTAAAVPGAAGEVLKNVKSKTDTKGQDYKGYLSMNYFLASKDQSQTLDVTARFESKNSSVPVEISVPHVPVQRNYRTNIIGNILTEQTVFNIIIDPNFNTPDYVVGWDGKTVTPVTPEGNVYKVSSPSQLAWIAQQVNTGAESFEGKTVQLTENINLGKQDWTPIGTATHPFKGTFDGKKNDTENYHVDAFNVSTTEAAGLFGILNGTVQNLTIESASVIGGANGAGIVAGQIFNTGKIDLVTVTDSNVEGNHWVGAVVGYAYGTISNCTVEDVTVTATPNAVSRALTYDNGDKVGGIVGQHPFDADGETVEKNTVRNVTLKGYRDIGGIAGAADGSRVTGNTVENVNIIWDQKNFFYEEKDANTGEIVGRLEDTKLTEGSNTANNVTIAVVTSDVDVDGLSKNEEGVYLISSLDALMWLVDEVNNNGQDFNGETVKLTTDINLAGIEWTPITGYLGTFDGGDHTISNLTVNVTDDEAAAGFFATARVVKNLTLTNVNVSGHYKTGAIVGDGLCAQIENCHVEGGTIVATPNSQNNNANNVGGIVGYLSAEPTAYVKDSSVKNLTITAYRSVGGIAGRTNGEAAAVENCTVENVIVTADMTPEYAEEDKASAAGEIVGDNRNNADLSTNTSKNVTVLALPLVSANYTLEDVKIHAETGSALTIAENATVTLEVKGNVTLTGANAGIEVPVGATLNIIGDGNLVVEGEKGSGIGNGGNKDGKATTGKILIKDLAHLTAKGNGEHAFGIGGTGAEVEIENTTVDYVKGGIVQPLLVNDTKYGKSEPEGGAAIGGAKITLNKVVVTEAHGGSKAAAIGAMFWQSTEISIDGCTITAYGGNASAGIGGSRVSGGENDDQTIVIEIANSTITSTGGEFGAGIGSGYNTHTASGKISKNDIQIINSEITANGGRGAAGIGTGYHVATLTGSIDDASTITAKAGELVDDDVVYWECPITYPQAIGYGGVDPNREYKNVTPTFKVKGEVIEEPKEYVIE